MRGWRWKRRKRRRRQRKRGNLLPRNPSFNLYRSLYCIAIDIATESIIMWFSMLSSLNHIFLLDYILQFDVCYYDNTVTLMGGAGTYIVWVRARAYVEYRSTSIFIVYVNIESSIFGMVCLWDASIVLMAEAPKIPLVAISCWTSLADQTALLATEQCHDVPPACLSYLRWQQGHLLQIISSNIRFLWWAPASVFGCGGVVLAVSETEVGTLCLWSVSILGVYTLPIF